MRKKIALGIVVVVLLFTVTLPVLASGMNYATSYETLWGAIWNGHVWVTDIPPRTGMASIGGKLGLR